MKNVDSEDVQAVCLIGFCLAVISTLLGTITCGLINGFGNAQFNALNYVSCCVPFWVTGIVIYIDAILTFLKDKTEQNKKVGLSMLVTLPAVSFIVIMMRMYI